MLFKFKSKVAGDLIMLEPNGRRVLEIIGKDPSQAGIILPAQMSAALSALEKAIQAEDEAIEKAKSATRITVIQISVMSIALPLAQVKPSLCANAACHLLSC
jgi:hypothetical protein